MEPFQGVSLTSSDDDDRTVGARGDAEADGAEQQGGELPAPAGSDDQEGGLGALPEQRAGGVLGEDVRREGRSGAPPRALRAAA